MRRARGQQVGGSFVREFSGFLGLGFGGSGGGGASGVGCGHRSLLFGFGGWGPKPWRLKAWFDGVGSELRSGKSRSELAFNQLFAVVGSCMRMPMRVARAQFGFSIMGVVAGTSPR